MSVISVCQNSRHDIVLPQFSGAMVLSYCISPPDSSRAVMPSITEVPVEDQRWQ